MFTVSQGKKAFHQNIHLTVTSKTAIIFKRIHKLLTSSSEESRRHQIKFVPTEAIRIVRFSPKQVQKITSKEYTLTLLNQGHRN